MRILKIKTNKAGGFDIIWQVQQKDNWVTCELDSSEKPRPEFTKALQGLKPDVIDMCEFTTGYGKTLEVTGITLSYNEPGVDYGIKIIAVKKMEKSIGTMSIVTPYKAKYEAEEKKPIEKRQVWDTTHNRVIPLLKEAKKYIDGERAQVEADLDLPKGKDGKKQKTPKEKAPAKDGKKKPSNKPNK